MLKEDNEFEKYVNEGGGLFFLKNQDLVISGQYMVKLDQYLTIVPILQE